MNKRQLIFNETVKSCIIKLKDKGYENLYAEWSDDKIPVSALLFREMNLIKRVFGKQSESALASLWYVLDSSISYNCDFGDSDFSYRSVAGESMLSFIKYKPEYKGRSKKWFEK